MKQIRRGVFETNSSSTHSMTICMKSDYDSWEAGETVLIDSLWGIPEEFRPSGRFCTKADAIEALKHSKYTKDDSIPEDEDELDDWLKENGFITYNKYEDDELEWFDGNYTTPNGDVVVVFGKYGRDG